jgi:RNA polymerase sigma-70 factor, ECF subfamily
MVGIRDRVVGHEPGGPAGESAGPGDIADPQVLWDVIVGEYQARLTAFARSRGVPDPDDVVQDVLSVAAEKLDSFTGTWTDFRAWLFTIAYRRVADHYRVTSRRRAFPLAAVSEPGDDLDPATWVSEAETHAEAMAALDGLTDRERTVVTMRLFEELSADDVGNRLGMSAGHVRVVQTRAVAKLRAQLAPQVFDRVRGVLVPATAAWAGGSDRLPGWLRASEARRPAASGLRARIRRVAADHVPAGSAERATEAASQLAAGPAVGAMGAVAALVVGVAATFGGAPDVAAGTEPSRTPVAVVTTLAAPGPVAGDAGPATELQPGTTTPSDEPPADPPDRPPATSSPPPPAAPTTAPPDPGPDAPTPEPTAPRPTAGEGTTDEPPPATLATGLDVAVGSGSAAVGAGAGVAAGPVGADVDADLDVSVDGASVDAGVVAEGDAGVDLGSVGAAAGLDASVDASVTDGGADIGS